MLRNFLALAVGLITEFLFALGLSRLIGLTGLEWRLSDPPSGSAEVWAMFLVSFLAGIVGAFVLLLINRVLVFRMLVLYTIISMAIEFFDVLDPLYNTPAWFRIALVATVPLQVWLGVQAARRWISLRPGREEAG
jgi:hypothetical protein